MAYCDYLHCVVCDAKTIYDSDLDYDSASSLGDIATICSKCIKTKRLKVVDASSSEPAGIHMYADFLPHKPEAGE